MLKDLGFQSLELEGFTVKVKDSTGFRPQSVQDGGFKESAGIVVEELVGLRDLGIDF